MLQEWSRNSFYHCGGPLKLVEACLSTKNDRESSFHHLECNVKLVQASLSARKDR